jgi:hypothetical protein
MLARLGEKTDRMVTVTGEMADVAAEGGFDLVDVAFIAFFAILTPDEQFANWRGD